MGIFEFLLVLCFFLAPTVALITIANGVVVWWKRRRAHYENRPGFPVELTQDDGDDSRER